MFFQNCKAQVSRLTAMNRLLEKENSLLRKQLEDKRFTAEADSVRKFVEEYREGGKEDDFLLIRCLLDLIVDVALAVRAYGCHHGRKVDTLFGDLIHNVPGCIFLIMNGADSLPVTRREFLDNVQDIKDMIRAERCDGMLHIDGSDMFLENGLVEKVAELFESYEGHHRNRSGGVFSGSV